MIDNLSWKEEKIMIESLANLIQQNDVGINNSWPAETTILPTEFNRSNLSSFSSGSINPSELS